MNIVETKHFLENTERKYCGHDLTFQLLRNEKPVNVDIQKKNKFKLYYNHPDTDRYYLVLVIAISNMNEIRIITTHPKRKKVMK